MSLMTEVVRSFRLTRVLHEGMHEKNLLKMRDPEW